MYELKKMERYLRVNLLGPGPQKKNLPGRGLKKFEKQCSKGAMLYSHPPDYVVPNLRHLLPDPIYSAKYAN